VDLPTRKFVNQLCKAKSFNTVYNSSRQQKLKYLSQREQLNWTLTKNLLAFASADGSTSQIASADKAFQVKCFTEELPTIVKLQRRRPDLYTSEWQCCSCGNTKETYSHVWLCPNRRQELLECIQLTQETFYIGIEEFTGTTVSDAQKLIFQQAKFWNLSVDTFQFDFIDLTKGLVPNDLVTLLMSMGCLEHQALSLATSSLQTLFKFL